MKVSRMAGGMVYLRCLSAVSRNVHVKAGSANQSTHTQAHTRTPLSRPAREKTTPDKPLRAIAIPSTLQYGGTSAITPNGTVSTFYRRLGSKTHFGVLGMARFGHVKAGPAFGA